MGTISEEIKAARLKKNVDIDEIVRQTHISRGHLLNIEADRLDLLPGGALRWLIFKQYCKALGLDSEEVLSRYRKAIPTDYKKSVTFALPKIRNRHPLFRFFFLTAATLTLLVLGTILLWREIVSKQAEIRNARSAVQTPAEIPVLTIPPSTTLPDPSAPGEDAPPGEAQTASPPPNPGINPTPAASTTTDSGKPLTVFQADSNTAQYAMNMWIEFQAPCWVSVNVDGKQVTRQEFYRGEKLPFRANNQISLILGNAGGVQIRINGSPLTRIGAVGEVKRLIFTPDNYKEYLSDAGDSKLQ